MPAYRVIREQCEIFVRRATKEVVADTEEEAIREVRYAHQDTLTWSAPEFSHRDEMEITAFVAQVPEAQEKVYEAFDALSRTIVEAGKDRLTSAQREKIERLVTDHHDAIQAIFDEVLTMTGQELVENEDPNVENGAEPSWTIRDKQAA